ncbi:tRNA G18 (ribose-2'-O)-methylase SpoU [Propionicimonas paludicola]|uniref:tRNA G18 (Ribose-2'-O)-methylase SpoU n=1 Tax=Propionicimonas paludicola TaxID=185243 RepID=A0A2A9CQJ2_9ACTN|nr:RNA methyltransferase [Propionicimonas paludicola]PFG16386.1 tRNA G18 (ribose-2'-O)-methylase SpoU [Propionicimonas paludicola]
MIVDVAEPGDERLADYVRLRESSLRHSLEAEQGLFIAEGSKVIRRAIEAGYRPRSFLLAPRWLDDLRDLLEAVPEVPVYLVSEEVAEQVTGFHVHRGALASLHREQRHTVAGLLSSARRLVVAEEIADHANIGAIARNAAGLGWDGFLLGPRCADPLYRRSVKVSMGTVLALPWARLDDWAQAVPLLQQAGFLVAALALSDDAVSLAEFAPRAAQATRLAVLLGSEGHGLSPRWISQADQVVRIPMRAGVDSLNVAAASAIACYELGLPQS